LIDKKTVFVLGAGASCPYGYPSGSRLRERIITPEELVFDYDIWQIDSKCTPAYKTQEISKFKDAFNKSHIKSIDMFMANNPKFAPVGKYIIAFETLRAERQSFFGEAEKLVSARNSKLGLPQQPLSLGDDWYSYLYKRLIEGLVGKDALPDFSNGNLAFITFNYDRSLEQFFYEALRYSFTEVSEERIVQSLKQLKILHVYGQIAPLKWQNPNDYVDYKHPIEESLLQRAANNIRTIHEEKQNPEWIEAQNLLEQAKRVFFLGFGYAPENMEVLKLPGIISKASKLCGTALGFESGEVRNIQNRISNGLESDSFLRHSLHGIEIEKEMDCLKLLRNYL